jgi:phosphopantothenoylcysteine decarboxylase
MITFGSVCQDPLDQTNDQLELLTMSFVAEKERTEGHTHVLLITTGSVASIKAPLIVSELLKVCMLYNSDHQSFDQQLSQYDSVKVEVVSTKLSRTFFDIQAVEKAGARVWTDEDEWKVSPAITLSCMP